MTTNTTEAALEACIERHLTGYVSDISATGVEEDSPPAPGHAGYVRGVSSDYNKDFAVDEAKLWSFLESTQPEELAKLHYKPDWKRQVLERLSRKIKKDGILSVLKRGLAMDAAHLTFLYRLPYSNLAPEVAAKFESNIFSCTRQLYYSNENQNSVDMVLFLNGLPIVTMELKNPWTGQNVYHARKQYCNDRDPQEPLFNFGRCLVHFAVDPDEAWMTTKLDKTKTYFLPFNKGYKHGKGNPLNPDGHKTAYLWNNILTRKSLCNIIEHFAKVTEEKDKKTKRIKKTLFFPRYHQLDVVRRLLADSREQGPGKRYLIQHSAGSGKSNSITWLAFQLIELYDKSGEHNLFDSVIVVTDRRVLDRQIDKNIRQFTEVKNLHAHADKSADLQKHLEDGKKLITTTIQKFPFIVEGIADMSDKNFAVIIDEAHSSQSGQAADKLNMSLGAEGTEDGQDEVLKAVEDYEELMRKHAVKRKMNSNASYYAFTATPKPTTLEKFGLKNKEGGFDPFDLYSMKQAIEEGFILNVLENYTTFKSYYEVQKSIRDNPLFDANKAQKKIRASVEANPETIAEKTEIIIEHFQSQVVRPKKIRGKAKGMVITRNIECAIRYYMAIKKELQRIKAPYQPIIAFSGTKKVDGIEHTEDSINGFSAKDIPDKLKEDGYRLLVVANKFLTGFDEPLLHSMYVDKALQGVIAVQALSRLNRCNNKMGKKEVFVLDFFNSASEIKKAFDPFFTATSLKEATDINILHDLQEQLEEYQLFTQEDLDTFNEKFFTGADAEELHPIIDETVTRFDMIEEEEQKVEYKIKAKHFVKVYAQLACMIPFENIQWEKLHWFLKFLIPKLKVKDKEKDALDALLESIDLSTYGLERTMIAQEIPLDDEDGELKPQNPNPRGMHEQPNPVPLDEIIDAFNNRFFSDWANTPEEQRIIIRSFVEQVRSHPDYEVKVANNDDKQNSNIALTKIIDDIVNARRRQEIDRYKSYQQDDDYKRALRGLVKNILDMTKDEPAA